MNGGLFFMKNILKKTLLCALCIANMSIYVACGASNDTSDGMSVDYASYEKSDGEYDDIADEEGEAIENEYSNGALGDSLYDSDDVFILTAGEWNDNQNWGFFTNLLSTGLVQFPKYTLAATNRVKVTVKDSSNNAVVNANVKALDTNGNTLWSSVSDKDGVAYLFLEDRDCTSIDRVEVSYNGEVQQYSLTLPPKQDSSNVGQSGLNTIDTQVDYVFDTPTERYANTQVMFILDTTGSMGDEMFYLQREFSGIAKTIGTDNVQYSVNFYRDKGDEYVTKCNDFTNDIQTVQQQLNSEDADGGGDEPEAVAEILKQTITTNGQWDSKAVKVAFLIFDAPPHEETKEVLDEAIKVASANGIKIVPVVSSNTNRETEVFARSLSIYTNGTYIFLTDDSGVGGEHLEPIIGDYTVEKLKDIIIRVVKQYQQ